MEPFPVSLSLPHAGAKGGHAVELLGPHLPQVAAWYGTSAVELKAMLLGGNGLRLDTQGRAVVEVAEMLGLSP